MVSCLGLGVPTSTHLLSQCKLTCQEPEPEPLPERLLENDRPLQQMLMTPRDGHLYDNGAAFTNPRSLQGVPLERISEDGEYWQSGWKSLDQYIAGEPFQEEQKMRYAHLYKAIQNQPNADSAEVRKLKDRAKLHSDNVSKQRKIREIFGRGQYHPNLVVSKEYLPPDGLCEQEIAYKLALKISDMQVLYARGELAMDPFDFIRWRMSQKMMEKDLWKRGAKHNPVRSIITSLGDYGSSGSSRQYEDPLFRRAVLRSAMHQGTLGKYRSTRRRERSSDSGANGGRSSSTSQGRRRQRRLSGQEERPSAPVETVEEKRARRLERLQMKRGQHETGYTGTARRGGAAK